jgi:uncharacterized membrane protein YiaA
MRFLRDVPEVAYWFFWLSLLLGFCVACLLIFLNQDYQLGYYIGVVLMVIVGALAIAETMGLIDETHDLKE